MEIEVTNKVALTSEQSDLLQSHSVLNIICALKSTLMLLSRNVRIPLTLQPSIDLCLQITDELSDIYATGMSVKKIGAYKKTILKNIKETVGGGINPGCEGEVVEDIANVNSILRVLDLGIEEMMRTYKFGEWRRFRIEKLSSEYNNFFKAIEQNAKGAYRIVFNPDLKGKSDYLLLFNVISKNKKIIVIPPAFKDVIRDLLANARKYSHPGSTIKSFLYCGGDQIKFIVEDNGIGIPEDEIEKVVEFGVRASNVRENGTMGWGFGLTKALSITRQFSGRMWIKSSQHKGTRIKITLPLPEKLRA